MIVALDATWCPTHHCCCCSAQAADAAKKQQVLNAAMSSGWGYHHQHHHQHHQQPQQRHQHIGSSSGFHGQPTAATRKHVEANGGDYGSGYQGGGEDEEDEYEDYSECEEESGQTVDGQVRASSRAEHMHHVCTAIDI
jgi:hypothetical protein